MHGAYLLSMGWTGMIPKRSGTWCCKFLTFDYTSSDESEISEDENGEDAKRFVTKRLAWESSKLRELKDLLDRSYRK